MPDLEAAHRDQFGFEVAHDCVELLETNSGAWVDEECERVSRWLMFLEAQATASGEALSVDGGDPAGLAAAVLPRLLAKHAARFAGTDPSRPMDGLVLGGIPNSLRGQAWATFLAQQPQPRPLKARPPAATSGRSGSADAVTRSEPGGGPAVRPAGKAAAEAEAAAAVPAARDEAAASGAAGASAAGPAAGSAPAPQQAAPAEACCSAQHEGWEHVWRPEYYAALVAVVEAFAHAFPPAPSSPSGSPLAHNSQHSSQKAAQQLAARAAAGVDVDWQADQDAAEAALAAAETAALQAGLSRRQLDAWKPNARAWLAQIGKDTTRTFPGHERMGEAGREALGRVLGAASLHDPGVGYCQGENFVAGALLLFAANEGVTFGCLVGVLQRVLPGYFSPAMVCPQVDQKVFRHLVEDAMPDVTEHLAALGADIAAPLTQWWLCAFVCCLPFEAVGRVWDLLFWECSPAVLFRTALALVELYSGALLAATDVLDAGTLLQDMARLTFDASRLLEVASRTYDYVTPAEVAALQRYYRREVMSEVLDRNSRRLTPAQARAAALRRQLLSPPPPAPPVDAAAEEAAEKAADVEWRYRRFGRATM